MPAGEYADAAAATAAAAANDDDDDDDDDDVYYYFMCLRIQKVFDGIPSEEEDPHENCDHDRY
jgi:hypothetical protein